MEGLPSRTAPGSGAPFHFISDDEQPRNNHTTAETLGPKYGRPLRPRPADFAQAYIENGEDALPDVYRAHMRAIRRWRDEVGRDELRAARRSYVVCQREIRRQMLRRRP